MKNYPGGKELINWYRKHHFGQTAIILVFMQVSVLLITHFDKKSFQNAAVMSNFLTGSLWPNCKNSQCQTS